MMGKALLTSNSEPKQFMLWSLMLKGGGGTLMMTMFCKHSQWDEHFWMLDVLFSTE